MVNPRIKMALPYAKCIISICHDIQMCEASALCFFFFPELCHESRVLLPCAFMWHCHSHGIHLNTFLRHRNMAREEMEACYVAIKHTYNISVFLCVRRCRQPIVSCEWLHLQTATAPAYTGVGRLTRCSL